MTRPQTTTRYIAALMLGALLLFGARKARAQGQILEIQGDVAIVDLGARDGVGPMAELTLLHRVVTNAPKDGKVLSGTFPIGSLTVIRAGEHLCAARIDVDVVHRAKVGSPVRLASPRRNFVDPWQEQVDRSKRQVVSPGGPAVSPGEEAPTNAGDVVSERERKRAESRVKAGRILAETVQGALGVELEERYAILEKMLAEHPLIHPQGVKRELDALRSLSNSLQEAKKNELPVEESQRMTRFERIAELDDSVRGIVVRKVPTRAPEGEPLSLAFWMDPRRAFHHGNLYYRSEGEESFRWLPLAKDGDGYLRVTIPGEAVIPDQLHYFVEIAADPDEPLASVLGDVDDPLAIEVESEFDKEAPSRMGRSQIRLFSDYVDFDGGFGSGFDQYYQFEGDFMYRFYRPVYAVRLGFGSIAGIGGPKDIIDASPTNDCRDEQGVYHCRRVNYNYVYSELEFRMGELFALMIRPQFGTGAKDLSDASADDLNRCSGEDIDDCDFFTSFGARARVRFGDERSSNLTLGLGIIGELGTAFEAAFTWDAIEEAPIVLSAQVADQPVPENFGVRLVADVGWRRLSWIYPSIRLSYQARDVDHDGISGGAAVNFDW